MTANPLRASARLPLLALVVAFIGFAVFALLRLPHPFAWIWVAALPVCLFGALRARGEIARGFSLAAFGTALMFAATEGFFAIRSALGGSGGVASSGSYFAGGYFVEGGELGYGPAPGARVTAKKVVNGTVAYDVVYTISEQGVRATPGDPRGDTWLFLGDSTMFGEGVNDDETLPAWFSAELGHRANVVNLGFHGYGPHQMLRALETDRARALLGGPVRQVVYQAIWDHPRRAAGRDDWDFYGPAYALTDSGVTYRGPFRSRLTGSALKAAKRSDLLRFALDRTLYRADPTDADLERYGRILERCAALARERYGAGFTIVYWDDDNDPGRRVLGRLRETKLPLLLVSEVIPRADWPALALPGDGHPKPDAHRRIAAALAAKFRAQALIPRANS